VGLQAAEESIQRRAVLYDRDGDYHFDTISAFIKSVRGSDPDAALYWLAKMVRAGEDPSFIFRRMIILASEDVGMADPHALQVVISCAEAFDRIGFPEGNFPLAHACIYLATAPKSNSAMAFFDALAEVDREDAEVPNHLRDASRDKEGFGHGEGYVYPHAYRDHWAAQQYLPTALKGKTFYNPSRIGYEGRIRDETLLKRELQAALIMGDTTADGEFLSWSASSKGREGWYKRLESGRSALLLRDRDLILGQCSPERHHRVLVAAANDGLLLWAALRAVPEGLAAALADNDTARETLLRYAAAIDEIDQPLIAVRQSGGLPSPAEADALFGCHSFDHIIAREPWRRGFGNSNAAAAFSAFADAARLLLAEGADVVLLQSPPKLGERISRILGSGGGSTQGAGPPPEPCVAALADAETSFFTDAGAADRWAWDAETLEHSFAAAGFSVDLSVVEQSEERLLTERDIALWFDPERSSWGKFIHTKVGSADFQALAAMLRDKAAGGPVLWKWQSILLKGIKN
jgi:putative ATPase